MQCVDNRGRDDPHWTFSTCGGWLAARDDVDVDREWGISHVRRRVAIEVVLVDAAISERDRSVRHELTESKHDAALKLGLEREVERC